MKCPDKEQLMLYVDHELDAKDSSIVKAHLAVCKNCKQEVALLAEELDFEGLLKNKVNISFQKHSVSNKIMEKIKKEPRPVKESDSPVWWNNLWIRILVPAFALAVALFVLFFGSPSQTSKAFKGQIYKVSIMANNSEEDCFVNGEHYSGTFVLKPETFKSLAGNFSVNIVTPSSSYTLNIDGKTNIRFDSLKMLPVFEDCKANITLNTDEEVKIIINGKESIVRKVSLVDKQKSDVSKQNIQENVKVETKNDNHVKDEKSLTKNIGNDNKSIDRDDEELESQMNVIYDETTTDSSKIAGENSDTLTDEESSDINIIGEQLESIIVESDSPFSD